MPLPDDWKKLSDLPKLTSAQLMAGDEVIMLTVGNKGARSELREIQSIIIDETFNTTQLPGGVESNDTVIIKRGGDYYVASLDQVLGGVVGGANITDETLVSWTQAEVWSVQSVVRDSNGIVETAVVVWPDGSVGNFNTLKVDEEWLAVDSYSVSHSLSGKVAVQPPVVRDSSTGQVVEQPAMQVQP